MATNKRAMVERMEVQNTYATPHVEGMTLGECLLVLGRALFVGAVLFAVCGALWWAMTLE